MACDWSDFVAVPRIVYYGCTPWVPEREHVHPEKTPTGYRGKARSKKCPWCKGNPDAAGEMCPGCNRMSVPAETKLARQRARSASELRRKPPPKFIPPKPPARKRGDKVA